MKRITLDKVASALERMEPRVTVAPEVAVRARRAIDRMLAVSG
jgi:quinolinate synthase